MNSEESSYRRVATCKGAERILEAAEELFAEQGFDAVSINAIAERAGLSKANVFHHFKSKNDLYLAVVRQACAAFSTHIDHLGQEEGSFPERLARYALEHLTQVLANERISRLIQRDLLEKGAQRGREFAEQVFGQNFARLVEILRTAQQKGELRADVDPTQVAIMVVGADITYFQARHVLRHLPDVEFADDPERYSRMAVDIFLRGILFRDDEKN